MLSYIAVHVSLVATQVGVEMLIYVFIYFSKTRKTQWPGIVTLGYRERCNGTERCSGTNSAMALTLQRKNIATKVHERLLSIEANNFQLQRPGHILKNVTEVEDNIILQGNCSKTHL